MASITCDEQQYASNWSVPGRSAGSFSYNWQQQIPHALAFTKASKSRRLIKDSRPTFRVGIRPFWMWYLRLILSMPSSRAASANVRKVDGLDVDEGSIEDNYFRATALDACYSLNLISAPFSRSTHTWRPGLTMARMHASLTVLRHRRLLHWLALREPSSLPPVRSGSCRTVQTVLRTRTLRSRLPCLLWSA